MSLTITIPGAVNVTTGSFAPAVLTIGVGVPGAQGPQGPAGQGVPAGGTAGQFLTKINGTDYNTDWTTVNLTAYAVKANNLSDLTSAPDARTHLGLGTMATATAADYSTTTAANGLYYPLTGNPSSFLTASALTGYATQSFVAANYAPIAAGLPTGGTVGQVLTKNSGTDYDDSWQTLIPGDRYLTSSTTSLTINNANKTLTIGTGLSYTTQQDIVIAHNAANHMHARVLTYDSGTGVMDVDVLTHSGSGTYASWTVNVGGTPALTSVVWGDITGTLGNQTDLATALGNKLETSTAASTYAALAGATFTGEVITPASTTSNAGLTITPGVAPTTPTNGELWATTTDLQVRLNGTTETIAEQSWVTAGFYPLSGNPSSFLVAADITGKANLSGATFTGLVTTPAATTTTAGFRVPHGTAPTSPVNGDIWTTTSGLLARINGSTKTFVNNVDGATLSGNFTFAGNLLTIGSPTGGLTVNVGTGATLSGSTKAISVGTNSLAGSTTNITIGSTTGTSTTTLQGTTNGVTAAADTNSVALATTAFVVGQAGSATPLVNGTAAVGTSLRYARQDHVHGTDTTRAPLASPTFTGTPTLPTGTIATTQTSGNNTTAVATTAFVQQEVPAASTTAAGKVELATNAEVVTSTATNLAIVPASLPFAITDPRLRSMAHITFTRVSGSGTVSTGNTPFGLREMFLGSLAAGRAGFAYGWTGSSAVNMSSSDWTRVNFSKKVWISGAAMCGATIGGTDYNGDSNTINRITLGGYTSDNVSGDMTVKGIGWKKVGGTSPFFTLTVHNGTTLTDVASTITQSGGKVISWMIYSDGTGNVTLYIDGVQAATTSAGPTGTTNANQATYREQVEAVATPTVRGIMECSGGAIYIEP